MITFNTNDTPPLIRHRIQKPEPKRIETRKKRTHTRPSAHKFTFILGTPSSEKTEIKKGARERKKPALGHEIQNIRGRGHYLGRSASFHFRAIRTYSVLSFALFDPLIMGVFRFVLYICEVKDFL